MKINLGCWNILLDGYLNIDLQELPFMRDENFPKSSFLQADILHIDEYFPANSVEEVRASHFLEHLSHFEVTQTLYKIWRILEPNGKLVAVVPDAERAIQEHKKRLQTGDCSCIEILPLEILGIPETSMHKTIWFDETVRYFVTRQGFFTLERLEQRNSIQEGNEICFVARAIKDSR